MKAISITFKDNSVIIAKQKIKLNELKKVNTNKIVSDTLYYTKNFIALSKSFLNNYFSSVDVAIFKDYESFLVIFKYFKFESIIFDFKKSLPDKVISVLINSKCVKSVECYFAASESVRKLTENNTLVKFNNNLIFTNDFIKSNDLDSMSEIYFKEVLSFYSEEDVFKNFEYFLSVNKSLSLIHLYIYSNEVISFITEKLSDYETSGVDVFIHQNDDNSEDISKGISFLRKVNKKYKNSDREIKIIYSEEFFKNNIFRELTINGLKLCMVALLYVGVVFIISNIYHEYVSILNLRKLENTLANTYEDISIDDVDDEEVNPPIVNENDNDNSVNEAPPEYVNHYANIPTSFDKLLSINQDVVGWINVNDTKVNYPVTHTTDNKYYLNHDIYKKNIMTGWIFMDYRNNPADLDKNTVIYGHNLRSGYMFGELSKTVYSNWYKNKSNQVITFNIIGREMKWRIFSIYRTDYTTDYLKVKFFNDEEFMNYIDMVRGRSIYNFNVNIDSSDKVLTLSTCSGSNNRRLAIHAVLIKE